MNFIMNIPLYIFWFKRYIVPKILGSKYCKLYITYKYYILLTPREHVSVTGGFCGKKKEGKTKLFKSYFGSVHYSNDPVILCLVVTI